MARKKLILRPAFFDIFGIVVFLFFIWVGYTNLNANLPLEPWIAWVILIIGVIGLIVDGRNVWEVYLK